MTTSVSLSVTASNAQVDVTETKNRFEYISHNTKTWDRLSQNNSPLATALKVTLVVPALLLALEAFKNAAILVANAFIGAANVTSNLLLGPRTVLVAQLLPVPSEEPQDLPFVETTVVESEAPVAELETVDVSEPVVTITPSVTEESDVESSFGDDIEIEILNIETSELSDTSELDDGIPVEAPASQSVLPKWLTVGNTVKAVAVAAGAFGLVRYGMAVYSNGGNFTQPVYDFGNAMRDSFNSLFAGKPPTADEATETAANAAKKTAEAAKDSVKAAETATKVTAEAAVDATATAAEAQLRALREAAAETTVKTTAEAAVKAAQATQEKVA